MLALEQLAKKWPLSNGGGGVIRPLLHPLGYWPGEDRGHFLLNVGRSQGSSVWCYKPKLEAICNAKYWALSTSTSTCTLVWHVSSLHLKRL